MEGQVRGLRGSEAGHWRNPDVSVRLGALAAQGSIPRDAVRQSVVADLEMEFLPAKITPAWNQEPQPWATLPGDTAEPWALRAGSLCMPVRWAVAGGKSWRVTKAGAALRPHQGIWHMISSDFDGVEVSGLHHIGIATANSRETCAFYCEHLGFALERVQDFPPQQVQVSLLRKGSELLEILEPLAPDCATGRFLAKRGPGFHHLCYAVADIHQGLEALQRQAVELVHNHVETGIFGPVLFVHPKYAHGVMVELLQPAQP